MGFFIAISIFLLFSLNKIKSLSYKIVFSRLPNALKA